MGLRQQTDRKSEIASQPELVKRSEALLQILNALGDIFSLTDSLTKTGCFALEEERGANWKGSGGAVPSTKEAKPSL